MFEWRVRPDVDRVLRCVAVFFLCGLVLCCVLWRRNLAAFSMSDCGLICNFAAVIDDDGKQGL